jgi:RND family efflux transporter MFP subunit
LTIVLAPKRRFAVPNGRGSVHHADLMSSSTGLRLAVVALVVLSGCGSKPNAEGAAKPAGSGRAGEPRTVRTAQAAEQRFEKSLDVLGELLALEESVVATKAAGRLEEIRFDIGDRVAAGALLARIEPRDAELRVLQADAAVRAARAVIGLPAEGDDDTIDPEHAPIVEYAKARLDAAVRSKERATALSQGGVSSPAEFDAAATEHQLSLSLLQEARETLENRRALLAQRRADLAVARQAVEDTRILAPFEGGVVERIANTGEYVSAGTPIARLVRDGSLRLRVRIPEPDVAHVHIGQQLRADVIGVGAVSARITRASPALDSRSRALFVEAEIPNAEHQLRSGSFAKVQIVLEADARALCVPVDAVVNFAGVDKVFVVESGRAREKRVAAGRREAQRIEILSGLEAGAEVVLSPGSLRDGDAVTTGR